MSEVTTEKLFADVKILIADAEQLVGATAGQAGERIAEMRQRLASKIEEAREAVAKCEKELREQAERAKKRTLTFLREESWSRLALAACLGVLLGLALRHPRSKSAGSEQ
ncbi:MAG TPA: DUF883 domain-containing protein [Candidatus Binatia bacterium]|jgi:ElaB/YqjD/DUF883 family membrane-anchored ribosome-binding protein